MAHSNVFSPSSASRLLACPGSRRLSETAPKKSTSYADEGSVAHLVGEAALRENKSAADYIGRTAAQNSAGYWSFGDRSDCVIEVTEDMADAVQVYVDTVRTELAAGKELLIEKQLDMSWLYPGVFGTADAVVVEPFGKMTVIDLKYGAGVAVEVCNNTQAKMYALGASYGGDCDDVEIVIVQPRARHVDGPVRRWLTTQAELERWGREELLPAIKATEAPDALLFAGDHCRFCPALAICPEVYRHAVEVAQTDFAGPIDLPNPDRMDVTTLARVLDSADLLKRWLSACFDHAQAVLETGDEVPGWKLVRKRANRAWADEQATVGKLLTTYRLDIYEQKLRSPAKMEKFIKEKGGNPKKELEGLVVKPEGGITMAPESDPRPPVTAISASADFTAIPA